MSAQIPAGSFEMTTLFILAKSLTNYGYAVGLYPAPANIHVSRACLKQMGYELSDMEDRDYGQTLFFTDDDGYSYCFRIATST
ncbi:hypothetical protein [Mucilaginibacter dorajii]|uniref:hypothetical protein n=1 Tax=Mucilaginibacter dorajii TaxID=692994 RepID=UPI00216A8F07|nr:hypothetical protein [Mucilaginibacter dorajii]MCS3735626.1 hypothetical protein [Mucilaginibacter dorajii]